MRFFIDKMSVRVLSELIRELRNKLNCSLLLMVLILWFRVTVGEL